MKKYSYDRQRAKLLLPLLESIGSEITERSKAIRGVESQIAAIAEDPAQAKRLMNLKADLAEQRRELRYARQELEAFGCQQAEDQGHLFLIPGVDGTLERGFQWELGQDTVHRVQASNTAA